MAGDWIKMRVWLCRDPRVISMADYLASERAFMDWLSDPVQRTCDRTAYEHVTRNVICALCVTGLCVTWGTAREQGDRVGDDLVVAHCDACTLDAIADVPCFGNAMVAVGWFMERFDGFGVFPKFFKENENPDGKHRRQNAERQANYRARKAAESNATSNVTDNVTVTTEKRREEKRRENTNTEARAKRARPAFEVLRIPESINPSAWAQWVEYRVSKRKPISAKAAAQQWTELSALTFDQQAACIEASIRNDWQGLFPEKHRNGSHRPGGSGGEDRSAAGRTRAAAATVFAEVAAARAGGDDLAAHGLDVRSQVG